MADFIDVIKQLGENKKSQDAGFNRVEQAVISGEKGGLSPAQAESAQKKTDSETKKSQGYFANIGTELSDVNKNLISGFKSLLTPAGALGGLLGLLVSPIALIKGFLAGLADSFRMLGKILKQTKLGGIIAAFFQTTLPNFFKAAFGPKSEIGKFLTKAKGFGRVMADPFFRMAADIKKFFTPNPKTAKIIKDSIKFITQPFTVMTRFFTSIKSAVTSPVLTKVIQGFKTIQKFVGTFGRLIGRLFLPITFIMTAFDTITGAIDGFFGTEGNLFQQFLGGIGGALKGFMKIVTVPLDLVKDLIGWIASKFGFTEFEKLLDSFSFTELFGKAVDWLYVDLPKFFFDLFSWQGIKDTLSGALDFANEIGKSLQRLIHKGLNWIKGIFGFGDDDSDFATATGKFDEGPLDIVFGFVNKFFSWLKGLFDIDVGKILKSFVPNWAMKWFEGGDENDYPEDMKEQQERTKRMKKLQSDLKSGDVEGL
jgi:hypothetical protein